MKKPLVIIVVLVVVAVGIYLMTSSSKPVVAPAETSQTPPAPAVTAPAPASSSVAVSMKSFSFTPGMLNIKTGTKVTWTNNDTVPHTITSDSGSLLNSGTLTPGQSFNFTFTSSGSVNYHCSIHPTMKASIVVQ